MMFLVFEQEREIFGGIVFLEEKNPFTGECFKFSRIDVRTDKDMTSGPCISHCTHRTLVRLYYCLRCLLGIPVVLVPDTKIMWCRHRKPGIPVHIADIDRIGDQCIGDTIYLTGDRLLIDPFQTLFQA